MVNLKLAIRSLTRSPVVTGVAVLSLALGLGANTAIFSLYDHLILRPLPVRDPDQLVNLGAPGPKSGSTSCNSAGSCDDVFSYPMFRDLERVQTAFTGIGGHVLFSANIGGPGQMPTSGNAAFVSGSYFPLLGLTPALGRLLTPQDAQVISAGAVAVLSYDYWTTTLGSRPTVLDETLVVNGQPVTIVGVAPRGFHGTTVGSFPAAFVPITMRNLLTRRGSDELRDRRAYWVYLFARLAPGVSIAQARQRLAGSYRAILTDVEAPLQQRMSPETLRRFVQKTLTIEPGRRGQSQTHKQARTPLLLLFGVTGIILFIACANIANLLLSRAVGRAQEMAVRLSLGARRGQLVRQLLAESCVLAALGGALSLVLGKWTLSALLAIVPPDASSVVSGLLNLKAMLFAGALSLVTGLLFGVFPALHSTRPNLIAVLRANTGQVSGARSAARFRSWLVTSQIALSMALLITAGLFVKSLINVGRVELGMRVDHVVTFTLTPELNGYRGNPTLALVDRVQRGLAATSGVTAVAASLVPVLSNSSWGSGVSVQGFTNPSGGRMESRFNEISAGYFRALGVPLVAGREFESADLTGGPKAAIVNEAFTRKFNLGRTAVGKYMSTSDGDSVKLDIQIVGVVRDAKYSAVREGIPPLFFTPFANDSTVGSMTFYARTTSDPALLVRAVPALVATVDPNLPVLRLRTLPEQVADNTKEDRIVSRLSAAFAVLATLLAAIGLYGVLAFTVAQRTREIGVRMALGANRAQVRAMVLGQVARMTAIGAVIGIGGAVAFGRAVQSLLFGLEGSDPVVIGASVLLLGLIALGAGFVPAYRASRVHPMVALRYE